ncbi:MAG: hypothetical protein INH41_02240 [Myxococcaceae bacterium]|jgi:hypothetical protein|nr:hypothetical protein [Myxococcaceae bacterium]MCA3011199.1 hypothetical protein [Myxococcaceae bacterium]
MTTSARFPFAATVVLALLAGCPGPKPTPPVEEEAEEPFDGETMSSVIPRVDPDSPFDAGVFVIDAGRVEVETRCCATTFSISDQEPADATGVLVGESSALRPGLPLRRTDAGWTASACVTLNTSSFYRYRFEWDGGTRDAGEVDLPDGGVEISIVPVTIVSERASDREPSVSDATGQQNYYRAVSACDGLDGGVPP